MELWNDDNADLPNDPEELISPEARAEVLASLAAMAAQRRRAEVEARDLPVGGG